ncbi:hypothetical protein HK096_011191 [Nowakowskiella sp. JEL0078]|nr:hypothetical protein HK096_011191 [Nowakowskiella sp. JEL0078]
MNPEKNSTTKSQDKDTIAPFVGIEGTQEKIITTQIPQASTCASESAPTINDFKFPPFVSHTFMEALRAKAKLDVQLPSLVEFATTANPILFTVIVSGVAFKTRVSSMINIGESVESAEWVNFLLSQLWPILDPSVFSFAIDILEDNFHLLAPPGVTDIRVADFDLGPNAPRFKNFKVLPLASDLNHVVLECDMSLSSAPYNNVGFKSAKNPMGSSTGRSRARVLAYARLGSTDVVTVSIPILIELLGVEAKVRIQIELIDKIPFARTARLSLLTKPTIRFEAKPLKLVNVMNFPVISQVINLVVNKTVEDIIVNPNALNVNLEQLLLGNVTVKDTKAVGIIKVTIYEARNLISADMNGKSDPFVTLDYGGYESHSISSITASGISTSLTTDTYIPVEKLVYNNEKLKSFESEVYTFDGHQHPKSGTTPKNAVPLARTRVVNSTLNPKFHETHYLIVTAEDVINNIPLRVRVLDFDNHSKNDLLGMLDYSVNEIVKHPGEKIVDGWQSLKFFGRNNPGNYGDLRFEMSYHPKVVIPESVSFRKISEEFKSGILVLHIHQCADLVIGERDALEPSSYIEVYYDEKAFFKTRVKAYNSAPYFNDLTETFIRDWENSIIRLVVKDQNSANQAEIGAAEVDLKVLTNTDNMSYTSIYYLLGGNGGGKVKVSKNESEKSNTLYISARGVLEIKEIEAKNIRILDLQGKHTTEAGIEFVFSKIYIPNATPAQLETAAVTSHNPIWNFETSQFFGFKVENRFQSPVRIEIKREKAHGVARVLQIKSRDANTKLLGFGEFYLGDIVDGEETEIVFPIQSSVKRRSKTISSLKSTASINSIIDEDEELKWQDALSTKLTEVKIENTESGHKAKKLRYVPTDIDNDQSLCLVRIVATFHSANEFPKINEEENSQKKEN